MRIMLISSTAFYPKLEAYAKALRPRHDVIFPFGYNHPRDDDHLSDHDYAAAMLLKSAEIMPSVDAVLVINLDKYACSYVPTGPYSKEKRRSLVGLNYIGGAVFLEIYDAWRNGKKIFILNPLPNNPYFLDELRIFSPIILDGNLSKIK